MRAFVVAVIILFVLIIAVGINDVVLNRIIGDMYYSVSTVDLSKGDGADEFFGIYSQYKVYERYISATVNHGDLTNIENDFHEILGCLKVGDTDGAIIAKSRLEGSFCHLRRLLSPNIDSII